MGWIGRLGDKWKIIRVSVNIFRGKVVREGREVRVYGGMGCKGFMFRERGKMVFFGLFREFFLVNFSLSFLLGVVLLRFGYLFVLGRNFVEELNGCGVVIGFEIFFLLF